MDVRALLAACVLRLAHRRFAQASRGVWKSCSRAGKNPRARSCCEVEPDYPPTAEGEPHGASVGVTTGGYWPQAFAVATRFVICLNFLNTENREKVPGAASDLGC
jgi:hypothetical protein